MKLFSLNRHAPPCPFDDRQLLNTFWPDIVAASLRNVAEVAVQCIPCVTVWHLLRRSPEIFLDCLRGCEISNLVVDGTRSHVSNPGDMEVFMHYDTFSAVDLVELPVSVIYSLL